MAKTKPTTDEDFMCKLIIAMFVLLVFIFMSL